MVTLPMRKFQKKAPAFAPQAPQKGVSLCSTSSITKRRTFLEAFSNEPSKRSSWKMTAQAFIRLFLPQGFQPLGRTAKHWTPQSARCLEIYESRSLFDLDIYVEVRLNLSAFEEGGNSRRFFLSFTGKSQGRCDAEK
eukprot:79988-Pelagomonas_calceolata.AAC.4